MSFTHAFLYVAQLLLVPFFCTVGLTSFLFVFVVSLPHRSSFRVLDLSLASASESASLYIMLSQCFLSRHGRWFLRFRSSCSLVFSSLSFLFLAPVHVLFRLVPLQLVYVSSRSLPGFLVALFRLFIISSTTLSTWPSFGRSTARNVRSIFLL